MLFGSDVKRAADGSATAQSGLASYAPLQQRMLVRHARPGKLGCEAVPRLEQSDDRIGDS